MNIKATGGGGGVAEVKIYFIFDMFCISRSRAGCKKPHQKILLLAEVMIFFNLAHNTVTISAQTSNRGISKRL